jgi:hypothetical protein
MPVPADLNNDGRLDLSVTDEGGGFSTLMGRGDGSFDNARSYALLGSAFGIAAADFNGGGRQDLAIAEISQIGVYLGSGGGAFGGGTNYVMNGEPAEAVLGDFDSDRRLDIAVSNGQGGAGLFLGNGDGTF